MEDRLIALWKNQKWIDNPGYDVPNPSTHPIFNEVGDDKRFGVSLDMRGEHIDVEIKNPVNIWNFKNYYFDMLSPERFFQLQWAMAIRNRDSMFLFATCYDEHTEELKACVVWYVMFRRDFMVEHVVPRARILADAILAKGENFDVSKCNLKTVFEPNYYDVFEEEYSMQFMLHASRIYFWGVK